MTREKDRFAALGQARQAGAAAEPTPAGPAGPTTSADLKMLSARVPLDVFREFSQHKLDAESAAQLRRVTTEAGVEALVRLLRDPEIRAAWRRELVMVVDEQG